MTEPAHKKNRRILIVDDNRAIHDDFRKILSSGTVAAAALDVTEAALFGKPTDAVRKIQYEIDSAYQGQEGVTLVKQALEAGRPYAMAFVDIRMPPGMDGVETTQKIWAVDPEVQIVICTAYADYSWDELFEKIGDHDGLVILKKPFDTVEALQLAHALTEKWWLHQQSKRKMEELEGMVAARTGELANSLSLLNATFESMSDGIVAVDLSGKVISSNTKFAAIWQFPAGMLARRDAAEMRVHTAGQVKDPETFLRRIKELQADPKAEVFDVIELKDGRIFERYIFPQRINGERVGEVINWRDITERKQAEKILRESEERFSSAFEFAPIGVALVSPDGHWLKVNRAICAIVGYSEAELLTRTFQDITHPEDLEADLEYVRRLLAGEIRSYQIEKRYVHADGHFVTVLLNVSLVRDGQGQPRYFISQIQDITERQRAKAALTQERNLLRTMIDNSPDAIYIKDPSGRKTLVNPAELKNMGCKTETEAIGKSDFEIYPQELAAEYFANDQAVIQTGQPLINHEEKVVTPDGETHWSLNTKIPLRDATGTIIGLVGMGRDITERKRIEAQLFQSQKMETVGKLAGGVAHEFNSILTAIIIQSDLLLGDLPAGSPLTESVTGIAKAANRAATLTRQLLAYGRRQFLQPETLDLNRIISGMESVFHNLAGADVGVQIVPAADLQAVKADAGQIEQVIINMVINARDAMPNGGKLTLETANVSLDAESVGRYLELKPGDYVMLAITDTGTGMSPEVKARAFEPFFSTKGVGQGTGLGLSTCYGIIKQSGGHISVYSEPGRGTAFKIYLPQVESPTKIPMQRLDTPDLPRGTETILLVEDDPALREMAATLLKRLGYTVFAAANGIEALGLKQQRGIGHIDLLFTDVVMPHMNGKELAERVVALFPHTKILFTSAYTENAIVHQGVLDKGVSLLQKPFTPSALARKLRAVLDGPDAPKPDAA
jgi:PAS domain S-box-containing protein